MENSNLDKVLEHYPELVNPNKYSLVEIFEKLKIGRSFDEQKYLDDCIFKIKKPKSIDKLIFGTTHKGLSLFKKYENQDTNIDWSPEDVYLVTTLFNDAWLIERPVIMFGYEFLTISEDGTNNRAWTEEEINKIAKAFNENL